MATAFIYALCEPDSLIVRYVGKTTDAARRLRQHLRISVKKKTYLGNWLRRVQSEGDLPRMEILRVSSRETWKEDEKACIQLAEEIGFSLVNTAEGGFGGNGLKGPQHYNFGKRGSQCPRFGQKHSEETKALIGLQSRGRKHPPRTAEHSKAISEALRKRYGTNKVPELRPRRSRPAFSAGERIEFLPNSEAYQGLSLRLCPFGLSEVFLRNAEEYLGTLDQH